MKISVKYFGLIAEKTNVGSEEILIDNSANLNLFLDSLKEKHPFLANLSFKTAVNQIIINENQDLKENDEVAILPPFSGG